MNKKAIRTFGRRLKNVFEGLSGFELERIRKTYTLTKSSHRQDAWFSYRAQFRTIIEKHDIDIVIDAGANEGQFGQKLRSFYRGEIISFEPVSSVFEKLSRTASKDPEWKVYKMALGSRDTSLEINVPEDSVFSSLLETNKDCPGLFGQSAVGYKKERVSVRRLDRLLDEIAPDIENKHVFLKMDTQGYDMEVFKGLGNKLKYINALQSEVSLVPIYETMPHWTESISAYEEAGFGIVGMFPVSRDSGRIIEYDCLLTKVGY